jgi:hypothetical protein
MTALARLTASQERRTIERYRAMDSNARLILAARQRIERAESLRRELEAGA